MLVQTQKGYLISISFTAARRKSTIDCLNNDYIDNADCNGNYSCKRKCHQISFPFV